MVKGEWWVGVLVLVSVSMVVMVMVLVVVVVAVRDSRLVINLRTLSSLCDRRRGFPGPPVAV